MSASERKVSGSCQCGAITFEVRGEPSMVIQCHCLNCQKSSGTGHVPIAVFPDSQVDIRGRTKTYNYLADSGGTVSSLFCPECGSSMFGSTTSIPGVTAVRLGAMDDSSAFQPQMDVYMKRLRNWDTPIAGAPAFEAMPPMPR